MPNAFFCFLSSTLRNGSGPLECQKETSIEVNTYEVNDLRHRQTFFSMRIRVQRRAISVVNAGPREKRRKVATFSLRS